MKKLIAVVLLVAAGAAYASCPPHAPYRCAIWAGKVICGCGL